MRKFLHVFLIPDLKCIRLFPRPRPICTFRDWFVKGLCVSKTRASKWTEHLLAVCDEDCDKHAKWKHYPFRAFVLMNMQCWRLLMECAEYWGVDANSLFSTMWFTKPEKNSDHWLLCRSTTCCFACPMNSSSSIRLHFILRHTSKTFVHVGPPPQCMHLFSYMQLFLVDHLQTACKVNVQSVWTHAQYGSGYLDLNKWGPHFHWNPSKRANAHRCKRGRLPLKR